MQTMIKRHFWGRNAIVVLVCAVFAAKAAAHIVEAKYLGDPEHAPVDTPVAPRVDTPVVAQPTKDGDQLVSRNMFCADCTPAVDTRASDPSQIMVTMLPIALLATSIGQRPEDSQATIINSENQQQGAYAVGDQVPGATGSGKLTSIHARYIDFENNGHTERLSLSGAATTTTAPPTVAAARPPADTPDGMQVSTSDGANYEIPKALVEKVLLDPMAFTQGARVVPAMKNGKPDGFKLYAIRPNSTIARLGLVNGDTLQSVNGFELTSVDKVLEVYTKLREATSLEVEVTRRGKPIVLKYSIR